MRNTIVVNLYGGPGAGKTTLAHMLIASIKAKGPTTTVEMVAEVAKDLVLERRGKSLGIQEYILGQQRLLTEIRMEEVDVIVTDAPILNSALYKPSHYPACFIEFVIWAARQTACIEVVVNRLPAPYDPVGRYHTEVEAKALDQTIRTFLQTHGFGPIELASPSFESAEALADLVIKRVQAIKAQAPVVADDAPAVYRETWSEGLA